MPKIVPIVEGDGEVPAVPALLRRILGAAMRYDIQVARPKNANGRGNLTKVGGLERFIRYAWKEPDCGAILVLLDSEGECPRDIARGFSKRIIAMGVIFPVVIVVAHRAYEAWILASISTVAGHLDLAEGLEPPADAESIRHPKAWINANFPQGRAYKETQDQEAMTHLMDIGLASQTRSFRRFLHAVDEAVDAIDRGCDPSPQPAKSVFRSAIALVTSRFTRSIDSCRDLTIGILRRSRSLNKIECRGWI